MKKNMQMILDIIKEAEEHLTAEQIYLVMKENESKAVLATVYNNLKTLLNRGDIMKISVNGFPDRYDIASKHDHLLCVECGKLSDIHLSDLTNSLQQQVDVNIESYDLKINYVCSECRDKNISNVS